MAIKTSINYVAADDNGKKIQKTLTSINPNASGADLLDFTQAMNSLSTDTYVSTARIERRDLERKTAASLEVAEVAAADACSFAKFGDGYAIPLDYTGDAVPYVKANATVIPTRIIYTTKYENSGNVARYCLCGRLADIDWQTYKIDGRPYPGAAKLTKVGEIVVAADETDNFDGAECTVTIYE